MHKFCDSEGREWSIRLNGWQLQKLKDELDFDARDHQSILKAAEDAALLCNVLYLLCEDQAKAANIGEREFGEAMAGDTIDDATEAYLAESIDFFPRSQRATLTKVLATMKELKAKVATLATEKIESQGMANLMTEALTEASRKIDQLLLGANTGSSSGKLQEQPA